MLVATNYEGLVQGSISSFRGHLFVLLIRVYDLQYLIV